MHSLSLAPPSYKPILKYVYVAPRSQEVLEYREFERRILCSYGEVIIHAGVRLSGGLRGHPCHPCYYKQPLIPHSVSKPPKVTDLAGKTLVYHRDIIRK